jgi:phosphate transport system substrate-binding protein
MAAVSSPARAFQTCFCAKADPKLKYCGEIVKFDPDDAITVRVGPAPISLPTLNFAECHAEVAPVSPARSDAGIDEAEKPVTQSETPVTHAEAFGIYGSNTIGEELMPRLIAAYAQHERLILEGDRCDGQLLLRGTLAGPAVAIACSAKGSHTGIPALAAGKADIAMLSRPISAEEQEIMRAADMKDMTTLRHEQAVALDGLIVIVSAENPASALTLDQIGRIFSGDIADWSQLGLPPGRISVYARNDDSGTRDTFNALVMEPRHRKLTGAAKLFTSSSDLSDQVAADPRGIGFVGYAYRRNAKALAVSEPCGIVHKATVATIKAEDYPLSRRLYLYTGKLHSVHALNLVYYVISDAAQEVISRSNFINQSIGAETSAETWARVRDYERARPTEPDLDFDVAAMQRLRFDAEHAERLSVSFRFRSGTATLDTKALQDVLRLAAYLREEARGRRILLMGFADAKGTFASNMALSRQRAEEVRRVILATGAGMSPDTIVVRGYSELMPVACNSDEEGREKNRRVEAWLVAE